MLRQSEVMKTLEGVLAVSSADATEAVLVETDSALTRFANNTIHQNVANRDVRLTVRVAVGKCIGVAGTSLLERRAIQDVVARATEIAKLVAEIPNFDGLPAPMEVQPVECFDSAVAECTPGLRAGLVERVVRRAQSVDATAAGAFATRASTIGVANSLGVRSFHAGTGTSLNLTMTVGRTDGDVGGSARATQLSWKLDDIDVDAAAEHVAGRARAAEHPVELEAAPYTVVLEPAAVATLVEFLSYLGFGAKAYQEKRSFMTGKLGLKITGENITIIDDGLDEAGVPFPIDFEGMPKKKIVLIGKGIARGLVHDSRTAAVEGKSSTGHALPANYASHGPQAWNLLMTGGDSSLDEMIASTGKGLLISDFHYVNVAEPMKTVLTGMTRFGTFLIEDGKVGKAVKNLRFTQNVLEAFEQVEAISRERERFEGCVVPAVKIAGFKFSGKTEF